jgi:predicted RNase H-like nuclease (RuvC/YqgF family)
MECKIHCLVKPNGTVSTKGSTREYEGMKSKIAEQAIRIEALEKENAELRRENAELRKTVEMQSKQIEMQSKQIEMLVHRIEFLEARN